MLPAFNTDGVGLNDDEVRRQRQQRIFQTGVLICFLLLLLEPGSKTLPPESSRNSTSQSDYSLRDSLKSAITSVPLDPGDIYAKNVTGYYKGRWIADNVTDDSYNDSVAEAYTPIANSLNIEHTTGNIFFQLSSHPLPGFEEEISSVQGLLKLIDGVMDKPDDITYIVHGVFLHRFGRLLALASSGGSQVKLVWPKSISTTSIKSPTTESSTQSGGLTYDGTRQLKYYNDLNIYELNEQADAFSENTAVFYQKENFIVQDDTSERSIMSMSGDKTEGIPVELAPLPISVQLDDSNTALDYDSLTIPFRSFPISSQTEKNGKSCIYRMDFEADRLSEKISSDSSYGSGERASDEDTWVSTLRGNWVGINCKFSASIGATVIRTNWAKAYPKAVNYSIVMTLICLFQIGLLFKQLYHSNTQASASRVSILCIGQQAILDALICIAHLLLCAIMQPLFFPLACIAFFKLVSFCIFEMRFLILVYQARQPQSFFESGWNSMRNELAVLHGRFYLALFASLALVWFLYREMAILVFLLYSFWVPQIVSNVQRWNRHSLHPVYLVGMSVSRLVLPLYLYGCPKSFLSVVLTKYETMNQVAISLVVWVTIQVLVLLAQDLFGPHFFIPKRFLPQKYNYYRPVPTGSRFGRDEAVPEADIETGNGMECVICYNAVDPSEQNHMVTPCDHCFHTECLQQWLNIKLECPTCRATLPPA